MLMNAVRGIFFILIILLSLMGIFFLLPLWISGGQGGDIPLLLGGIPFYAGLGVVWWLMVDKRKGATLLGAFFLAIPIIALGGTAIALLFSSS